MKTFWRTIGISGFLLALTATCAAAAPQVFISLYSPRLEGEGWGAGVVRVTLRDGLGATKSYAEATVSGGGWDVWLQDDAAVCPGDLVTVQWGVQTHQHEVADVTISRLSAGRNQIAGRVDPPKTVIGFNVIREDLTLTGWTDREDVFIGSSADGTFSFDTGVAIPGLDLKRGDLVKAGYVDGAFVVTRSEFVPGIKATVGSDQVDLVARGGKTYRLALLDRRGRTRASSTAFIAGPGEEDRVLFRRPDGRPIPIRSGNRIVVDGRSGFTATVPPMQLEVGPSSVGGRTIPGAMLSVVVDLYNDGIYVKRLKCYQASDPEGNFSCPWPAENFKAGDAVFLSMQHPLGDIYFWGSKVLP